MTYDDEEQALIDLVKRTYGVTDPVDMTTELGDMRASGGRWFYAEDHRRFQRVFEAHYQRAFPAGTITGKIILWELLWIVDTP